MMARRTRFHLIRSSCRRCNAPVYTGNRALIGPADMKARYDRICRSCWTEADAEALDAETRARLREFAGRW